MAKARDDFGDFLTASDADSTLFKMRAFGQGHIDIEPLVTATGKQEKGFATRAFSDADLIALYIDLVRSTRRNAFVYRTRRTRLDGNMLRLGQCFQPCQNLGRCIAPFLIAAGGKRCHAANSLYPSRSSSSASSGPPLRVMRPSARTWTKSGCT